jgi:hypothetical protein
MRESSSGRVLRDVRWGRRPLGAAIALALVVGVGVWGLLDVRRRWLISDFTVYVVGGAAFFDGRNPYEVTNPRGWHYVYPPLFGIMVSPLRSLSYPNQVTVWFLVSIALAVLCIHEARALVRVVGLQQARDGVAVPLPRWMAIAAGVSVLPSVLDSLQRGQMGIAVTYLLLLGFRLALQLRSRLHGVLGGVVMAWPASVKLSPIVPIGYAVVLWLLAWIRTGSRCALARAATVACGTALGLLLFLFVFPGAVLGFRANVAHLMTWADRMRVSVQMGSEGDNIRLPRNQSMTNALEMFNRWVPRHGTAAQRRAPRDPVYQDLLVTPRVSDGLVRPFVWIVRMALIVLPLLVAWRRGGEPIGVAATFGLACMVTLLIAPVSWGHHYVMALPAVLFVPWWLELHGRPIAARALALLPLALAGLHYLVIDTNLITRPIGAWFAWSIGAMGTGLTLWCLTACVLMLAPRDAPRTAVRVAGG